MICNFEGNVHERACIQAFRQCSRGKVVGYAQAIIFALNLKLRLTEKERSLKPEPDLFVCTGPYAKDLLQKIGKNRPKVFRTGYLLRGLPFAKGVQDHKRSRKILIALDGLASTAILLEWILEQAPLLDGFEVILRFHPNMPASRIISRITASIPDNFRVSENDISEDISGCLCVFYRHSSVGILAISNGVPAVHLNIDSPLSGDPIEELFAYKWVVNSGAQMAETILAIQESGDGEDEKLLSRAREFINGYFHRPLVTEPELFIS
jgi:hypothetical protein